MEAYHAAIKGNTSLAASPTKTRQSQLNHVLTSIYTLKLEVMRVAVKLIPKRPARQALPQSSAGVL